MSNDDKVRLAAVKVFGALSYEFLLAQISKEIFETLGERCKDRKGAVRVEAVHVLARMWHLAYNDLSFPFFQTTTDL